MTTQLVRDLHINLYYRNPLPFKVPDRALHGAHRSVELHFCMIILCWVPNYNAGAAYIYIHTVIKFRRAGWSTGEK